MILQIFYQIVSWIHLITRKQRQQEIMSNNIARNMFNNCILNMSKIISDDIRTISYHKVIHFVYTFFLWSGQESWYRIWWREWYFTIALKLWLHLVLVVLVLWCCVQNLECRLKNVDMHLLSTWTNDVRLPIFSLIARWLIPILNI